MRRSLLRRGEPKEELGGSRSLSCVVACSPFRFSLIFFLVSSFSLSFSGKIPGVLVSSLFLCVLSRYSEPASLHQDSAEEEVEGRRERRRFCKANFPRISPPFHRSKPLFFFFPFCFSRKQMLLSLIFVETVSVPDICADPFCLTCELEGP